MTYIVKPSFRHPKLPTNALGYTHRDYEGSISTLCAGCGHDSISAAIIQACFELALPPHRIAKLRGIGCSSKTPTYFLGQSHGFNSVHGRMPSVLTGANLANRDLIYLGVSGDGDIGLDRARPVRPLHPPRRQHGLYRREQRRIRPDQGPVLGHRRQGLEDAGAAPVNTDSPIDLVALALQLGASYVARSFSGDKHQLVPLIKGAIEHKGAAFIDVDLALRRVQQQPRNRPRASSMSAPITRRSTSSISWSSASRSPPITRPARSKPWCSTTARSLRLRKLAPGLRPARPDLGDDLSGSSATPPARSSPGSSSSSPITAICTISSTRSRHRSTRWAKPIYAPAPRCSPITTRRTAEQLHHFPARSSGHPGKDLGRMTGNRLGRLTHRAAPGI